MYRPSALVSVFALLPLASALCPLNGPSFPQPTGLAESSILKDAFEDFKKYLDEGLATGDSSYGPVVPAAAHAFQIFSLGDQKPIFEYYYDGTTLKDSPGVKTVDGDSIFRVGSISKLVTVYLVLAELGDKAWSIRVADVVPELKGLPESKTNPIDLVNWDQVTLGALAGQVSGIARDIIGPYSFEGNPKIWGLPPLEPPDFEDCSGPGNSNLCDRSAFFDVLKRRQPTYLPNTKATYCNTAFVVLAYALESITGRKFEDMLQSTLITPLKLEGFSYRKPADTSRGVIPYNTTISFWDRDVGEASPMGGFFASLNDLSKIGRSILGSTLVDDATTRAWFQPTASNSDLVTLIGRPWEIYRAAGIPNRVVVDIYSKGGTIGAYQAYLAVVPDFNIGFSAGVAGGGGDHGWIDAYVADKIFPALEDEARSQANAAYAGTYVATNGLNTTLTLTTEAGLPGLAVTQFISNGTNFLATLGVAIGSAGKPGFLRLYPTNLQRETGNGTEISWRASPEFPQPITSGAYSGCLGWFNIDSLSHGFRGVDQMVFELDKKGNAVTVSPEAFQIKLKKV